MASVLSKIINAAFTDSLYKEDEIPPDGSMPVGMVHAEGVRGMFGLHPTRLESHRSEVISAINLVHPAFHLSGEEAGGASFLQLPVLADGTHWAEHQTCNELVVLAIGLGLGGICGTREIWHLMPGGVPYLWLDANGETC